MSHRSLLFIQLAVVAVLAGLHIYALAHFLYWSFPWVDLVSHLLGGMWAGIFALWFSRKVSKEPSILFCASAALAIGISWEFFEALNGITQLSSEIPDTFGDVSMDVLGGYVGALLGKRVDAV